MELRHLRYFDAAARAGNLHLAAQKLHIVQPALSRQIQALEEELGTTLFERTSQGVHLTPAGQVFHEGARRILAEVERLSTRTQQAARGQVGTLSVSYNDVAIRCPSVSEASREFRLKFPQVELKFTLAKSQAQLEALQEGTVDAGFLLDRPAHLSEFDAFPIATDDRALVLPERHRLAHAEQIQLRDLAEEDFVLTRRDQLGSGWGRIFAVCRAGGLEPRVVQEVDNEQGILSLLLAGMGVSLLTESARELLPRGLVMRRVSDFSVPMTLELVWLRVNASPLLANFVEVVRRVHQVRLSAGGAGADRAEPSAS